MTDATAEAPDQGAMTFREHLRELRTRLLRATLGVVVAFFVAWTFHLELFDFLSAPVRTALANNHLFAIKALQITESIEVYMKLSVVGGLFLASPWVFYQVWAFVAPGLLSKEKRLAVPVVAGSVACFLLGATFCYLVVLPFMTDFLIKLTLDAPGLTLEPTLASTMSFSLLMLVAFGAVFELPLFLYVLAAMGLVTAKGLLGFYRYWVVISFVVGAVLTPTPDPINQALMAGPLVVLYGVGVVIAWLVQREPGRTVSRRTLVLVATGLVALAAAGIGLVLGERETGGLDDVPADVRQLIGVHAGSLERVRQQAESSPEATAALAPLGLVDALRLGALHDPLLLLLRFDQGLALVAAPADAPAVVRRLARERQASLVATPSGPSVWFAVGSQRLRAVAAGQHALWLGTDEALARLTAVRRGDRPALLGQPVLAERVAALRASGPLWSLTPGTAGIAGWLPGGALASNVQLAAAVLDRDKPELTLRFECKGPEAAAALRDRIDAWVADTRRDAPPAPGQRPGRALGERVRELSLVVARISEASSRLLPQGSRDHQVLVAQSAEALKIASDLVAAVETANAAPPLGPLQALVQPPALSKAEARSTTVTWTVQGDAGLVLAALAAPAEPGLVPAEVRQLRQPLAPPPARPTVPQRASVAPEIQPARGARGLPAPAAQVP